MRRKLRYETWYYLHFYTYLAIALAFSHQFANGAAFVSDLAARFWWASLYLIVAALVLWYRIVVPARDFVRHGFRVAGVRHETPRTVSINIRGKRLRELEAEAGQFFRWRFLCRGQWWQSHPFSLSAAPNDELMRITVRDVGDHSASLSGLKPGTRVLAEGPFGAFVPIRTGRPALLLAGGVGITPLRAMFDHAGRHGHADLPGEHLAGHRVPVGARRDRRGPRRHRALRGRVAALTEAGVPRRRIHYESFEF